MKTMSILASLLVATCLTQSGWAQSTTGGRSGGSTASTGTGYLTEGKRTTTSSAKSMTIADEGASRAYMYVPPTSATKAKNRSASPNGSTHAIADPAASQATPATKKKSAPR